MKVIVTLKWKWCHVHKCTGNCQNVIMLVKFSSFAALDIVKCYNFCYSMWQKHDVIKWKHIMCNWPFVWGIHRSSVNSPHKGQWRGALMFSLIWAWINDWVNICEAGDLRHHHANYDVIAMILSTWGHICINAAIFSLQLVNSQPLGHVNEKDGKWFFAPSWCILISSFHFFQQG